MKIYTKTGDKKETSLYDNSRVLKSNIRIDSLGDIDELNSILGIVLSYEPLENTNTILKDIQKILFRLSSDIATPITSNISVNRISSIDVIDIEQLIDNLDSELPELKEFIIPGGNKTSSFLHQARSVARRAERKIVQIKDMNEELLKYINRLSDLLFVIARIENTK